MLVTLAHLVCLWGLLFIGIHPTLVARGNINVLVHVHGLGECTALSGMFTYLGMCVMLLIFKEDYSTANFQPHHLLCIHSMIMNLTICI